MLHLQTSGSQAHKIILNQLFVDVINFRLLTYVCHIVTSGRAGPAMMPGPRKEKTFAHRRCVRNFGHVHILQNY